jgi:hypothetical protein
MKSQEVVQPSYGFAILVQDGVGRLHAFLYLSAVKESIYNQRRPKHFVPYVFKYAP